MKLPSKSQSILNEKDAFLKLQSIGQEHLLKHWSILTAEEKNNLIKQILHLDTDLFRRQKKELSEIFVESVQKLDPFRAYSPEGNLEDYHLGMEIVGAGKAALLVLAGGQGSRLRCQGPKGCYPITNICHKSLFQLLAEKIRAASMQLNRPLEVAIMVSPLNDGETQFFFEQHNYFGLKPNQVTFFYQQMWPLLDFEGNLFLESKNQIAQGPNGNGGVFRLLQEQNILNKWEKAGIELIHVLPIDNPLAPVFDFELFGFHARCKNHVSLKTILKKFAAENLGVLACHNKQTVVREYFELSPSEKAAKNPDGTFKYGMANLGIYCFSLPFIKKAAECDLPLHKAKKTVKMMDLHGQSTLPKAPNAWKFEEFIFDVLPLTEYLKALLSNRASCFAPLKNLEGEDSIDTVRAALLAFDRHIFAKVTGNLPPPGVVFELAPQFYYPTPELLEKWKGKPFPHKEYIHE